MCSWCYGFANEITKVKNDLPENVDFQIIMGGLRANGTETMAELKDFLTHHWEDVEKRSGQKFNYGILDSSDLLYNTEPACRAVVTMRKLKPKNEFAYFKDVQQAFYLDNHNPSIAASYAQLAEKHGVDSALFHQTFASSEMIKATEKDFEAARLMGANSFPTVLMKIDDQFYLVARGFSTAKDLNKNIEKALSLAKTERQ